MTITVSLETAKKLKEAGWTKPTKLVWADSEEWGIHVEWWDGHAPNSMIRYAPTADEMLADLPEIVDKDCYDAVLEVSKINSKYRVGYYSYGHHRYYNPYKDNESLAEAVAELWLWAKANGYIDKQEAQG